jgi:hypothetical protein
VFGGGVLQSTIAMIHCRQDFSFLYLNFRSFDLLLTRGGCFFMHHQHNNQQKASLYIFFIVGLIIDTLCHHHHHHHHHHLSSPQLTTVDHACRNPAINYHQW